MSVVYFTRLKTAITAADLVNAWVYADTHPEEIEAAIRENSEVMQEVEP